MRLKHAMCWVEVATENYSAKLFSSWFSFPMKFILHNKKHKWFLSSVHRDHDHSNLVALSLASTTKLSRKRQHYRKKILKFSWSSTLYLTTDEAQWIEKVFRFFFVSFTTVIADSNILNFQALIQIFSLIFISNLSTLASWANEYTKLWVNFFIKWAQLSNETFLIFIFHIAPNAEFFVFLNENFPLLTSFLFEFERSCSEINGIMSHSRNYIFTTNLI